MKYTLPVKPHLEAGLAHIMLVNGYGVQMPEKSGKQALFHIRKPSFHS